MDRGALFPLGARPLAGRPAPEGRPAICWPPPFPPPPPPPPCGLPPRCAFTAGLPPPCPPPCLALPFASAVAGKLSMIAALHANPHCRNRFDMTPPSPVELVRPLSSTGTNLHAPCRISARLLTCLCKML